MTVASIAIPSPAAVAQRPGLRVLVMAASDVAAVGTAMLVSLLLKYDLRAAELADYWNLFPGLLLFPLAFAFGGLYTRAVYSPVRELRRITLTVTLMFVLLATLLFLLKQGSAYSRQVFLVGWVLTVVLAPVCRTIARKLWARRLWWGLPVAVFGSPESTARVVADLNGRPETGLRPVAVFQSHDLGDAVQGVPVLGDFRTAALYAERMHLSDAIIAMPDVQGNSVTQMLESHANPFSHIYLIPDLEGLSSVDIEATDLCNRFALRVRRNLLIPEYQLVKRSIDIVLSSVALLLLLPVMLVVAILIRLESPGNALFGGWRVGYAGRRFRVWKFRTMYSNGNQILEAHFRNHPEERDYWNTWMKLRKDPRITPLGAILRRTSLDEVPQLWNVLRGEMSMVGPRPILEEEVAKRGDQFGIFCRVLPGLTGLWQVSGRNLTDFNRRMELDNYYVRNWSPWLDLYLLARTVKTVLLGEGAY